MPFHDDLLVCAQTMIPSDLAPPAPAATLRRGVSTAYYALFHLLVTETMARVIGDPLLRTDLSRSIDHGPTRKLCKEYSDAKVVGGVWQLANGEVIPEALQSIGSAFVGLLESRFRADYDTTPASDFSPSDAYKLLMTVELAFLDWATVRGDPATGRFLGKLFLASLTKRTI